MKKALPLEHKRTIELLAPAGETDSIKTAIIAGADAIYCGLDKFNARNRAGNLSFEELYGVLHLAHSYDCAVFLTLNIIFVESEIPALLRLLNKLINTQIDGVIVQDLGLLYLLEKYFPGLHVHASTQLTTHNKGQIQFLDRLGATRVNLSRELNLQEINELTEVAHARDMFVEVFVHGSYCISFSGICYFSSVLNGTSGNRGRCGQPCRGEFKKTAAGNRFPLNLKDNSSYFDLKELADAGVDSVKIEGRIKKFHYVYTVVKAWKTQLKSLAVSGTLQGDNSQLYTVFNRDFSNGFLKGTITQDMFIDNPRDNSALHLAGIYGGTSKENIDKAKRALFDHKTDIITDVREKITLLSIKKRPLTIQVSGKEGSVLQIYVQTPDNEFTVSSTSRLVAQTTKNTASCLSRESLLERLKHINNTAFFINNLDVSRLGKDLFIPYKELTLLKNKIFCILNNNQEFQSLVDVPVIKRHSRQSISPLLSLIISSPDDVYLCEKSGADVYFQLPDSLKNTCSKFADVFSKNNQLIPWFPSILIGDDYHCAVELLKNLQAKCIVTDNTGIAYEAVQRGIPWIAGPCLNISNSFSLLCLKEKWNCSGAFISNELSKNQIKAIKRPENFKLYYTMYQPVLLLTSRQCLLSQVSGCEKEIVDDDCIQHCEQSATITNVDKTSLYIDKRQGNYHRLYCETQCLNTEIVEDIRDLFFSFFIDLRSIKTSTKIQGDKVIIVRLFENFLKGEPGSVAALKRHIHPFSNSQYYKGI